MTPQELKASILQLAIQGKLVEQRPEEGTGEELYQQIQKEKAELIKAKKIKKDKQLPEITEDEVPFEIPDSWKWVRLSEIGLTQTGNTPKKAHPEYFGSYIPFLGPGDIQNGVVDYCNQGLSKQGKEVGRVAVTNSILQVCIGGSIGKCAMVDRDVTFNQQINAITPICANAQFIYYILNSAYFTSFMKEHAGGTATPIINRGLWDAIVIPLPPIAEQHRIVAKIEELLPYIDRYEKAWTKLEEFNKKFPGDMQKSILQYAIQGKLVEQRPEEGTGEELYQQIQKEKSDLIKAKKIKKGKSLPEITEDKVPFEIPESWKWCRLSEIVSVLGDGLHGTPQYDMDGDYYFVNGNNLSNGKILIKDDTKRVNKEEWEKYKKPLDDTTVLVSINGTLGNIAFYVDEKVMLGKSACYFNLLIKDIKFYIYWLIKTDYFLKYAVLSATGTTIKNVSLKAMNNLLIPLPPLAEQKRIVTKLEEILPLCEKLK